ncbi:uncharacterized protein LOC6562312 [Drosophila grimshawi]|uniref:GH10988 n=1 Tax=Drosophila grimshawi TaxID=7222 RepID=B4JBP1_DROGR|nr:uncharacterized protein LOC6562312 [Drosophila grimshawi]EDW02976.1 GH10988 [Drosophila grimshawi]
MFNLPLLLCCPLLWLVGAAAVLSVESQLNAKDYQLDFLHTLAEFAEQRAELSLNDYLQQLQQNAIYANYSEQLNNARTSQKLQPKVLLIKQLLDAQQHIKLDMEHTCVLRNLLFISRLKQQLRAARDASNQEIRQLRVLRLCQQFERPRPTSVHRLINDQTVGAALEHLNLTQSATNETRLDLSQFGKQLYERVKLSGAEIIDSYVHILRGLLQDILDGEHADLSEKTTQLERLLKQLDDMLAIPDFFDKRQSIYAFLERYLSPRPDQVIQGDIEQHFTEQLMEQLKTKGLDLFVIFLFSNFEFLEQVHEHWLQLLPQTPSLLYDETSRQLYDIQQLYESFKLDTESAAKYEAYTAALRRLHERTVDEGQENHHIFEMLNNAAQNVGSVTFNMIKAKCKELL